MDNKFAGFDEPKENWSKLPHALIEALPLVESMAELKVILYVLRHTWGYHDDEKRISVDEFVSGRKHSQRYLDSHPDSPARIDNGTGMSENAIKSGISKAIKHGFIKMWIDESDKARIKRYFSLSTSEGQELTPKGQKLPPGEAEVDPRSKKETIERNQQEKNIHVANATTTPQPSVPISFQEWQQALLTYKNKNGLLRRMIEILYPQLSPPDYGYIGKGSGSLFKGKYRRGISFFVIGYHPLFQFFRCLYRIKNKPFLLGSMIELFGFFFCYFRKEKILLTDDIVQYVRREQLRRLKTIFMR